MQCAFALWDRCEAKANTNSCRITRNYSTMARIEPTSVLYADLYYNRGCKIRREVIFDSINFCGGDHQAIRIAYDGVSESREHILYWKDSENLREVASTSPDFALLKSQRSERRNTTAWNFLHLVRTDDFDGLGLEYNGNRIWELFWSMEDRIAASPRQCPSAIAMTPGSVTLSPDGYFLAAVYSRDDSDMREEPELCVWDLRPMVKELLWQARRNFLLFLYGHQLLTLPESSRVAKTHSYITGGTLDGTALACNGLGTALLTGPQGPQACCKVICQTALVKCIAQYLS